MADFICEGLPCPSQSRAVVSFYMTLVLSHPLAEAVAHTLPAHVISLMLLPRLHSPVAVPIVTGLSLNNSLKPIRLLLLFVPLPWIFVCSGTCVPLPLRAPSLS